MVSSPAEMKGNNRTCQCQFSHTALNMQASYHYCTYMHVRDIIQSPHFTNWSCWSKVATHSNPQMSTHETLNPWHMGHGLPRVGKSQPTTHTHQPIGPKPMGCFNPCPTLPVDHSAPSRIWMQIEILNRRWHLWAIHVVSRYCLCKVVLLLHWWHHYW